MGDIYLFLKQTSHLNKTPKYTMFNREALTFLGGTHRINIRIRERLFGKNLMNPIVRELTAIPMTIVYSCYIFKCKCVIISEFGHLVNNTSHINLCFVTGLFWCLRTRIRYCCQLLMVSRTGSSC